MNAIILVVASGETIVSSLIWLVCIGLVFWLLNYLIDYCKIPEPFNKVAKVILMVAAVVLLINLILSIAGHPLIRW